MSETSKIKKISFELIRDADELKKLICGKEDHLPDCVIDYKNPEIPPEKGKPHYSVAYLG